MKNKTLTKNGICYTSIKTEKEIAEIQSELNLAEGLKQHIRYLEAVKDATRFKIVYLLMCHERLCVCDLANILNVSSSAISQHLRKLRDMDLVFVTRQKQTLFYALKNCDFITFFKRFNHEDKTGK